MHLRLDPKTGIAAYPEVWETEEWVSPHPLPDPTVIAAIEVERDNRQEDDMAVEILRCVVGSHAHGLATPESDYDYRGVFVQPTKELLSLGVKPQNNSWIEGDVDNTSYEIGHFLFLATKSNPTILETFVAPQANGKFPTQHLAWGERLRHLFPYVWDKRAVLNAFTGYGYNQRKKFLDDKDQRGGKYAVAWLRTLIMAHQMFTEGTMTLETRNLPDYERLVRWKAGGWEIGEVMSVTKAWIDKVHAAYDSAPEHETDFTVVNVFLLDIRREFWL